MSFEDPLPWDEREWCLAVPSPTGCGGSNPKTGQPSLLQRNAPGLTKLAMQRSHDSIYEARYHRIVPIPYSFFDSKSRLTERHQMLRPDTVVNPDTSAPSSHIHGSRVQVADCHLPGSSTSRSLGVDFVVAEKIPIRRLPTYIEVDSGTYRHPPCRAVPMGFRNSLIVRRHTSPSTC